MNIWCEHAFKAAFALRALLQVGFLKHLEDVSTVLLDLVCLVLFLHVIPDRLMMIRSDLCVGHWLLSDSLCKQQSHWMITINGDGNVCTCKRIFPTDILQQNIWITDLTPCFSWWFWQLQALIHATAVINADFEMNWLFFKRVLEVFGKHKSPLLEL